VKALHHEAIEFARIRDALADKWPVHARDGSEESLARARDADLAIVAAEQGGSNAILNLNRHVGNEAMGRIAEAMSVDVRGNTLSRLRGMRFLAENRLAVENDAQ